ncbi:MAG: hypothetical protein KDA24_03450 [Deltaproteobacteria bacterium]|nr:hypothetical protein [Deltaproteobacteria bacterium]
MREAPHALAWLFLHPMAVALLAGALAGDMSIAIIVAVALTPLISERDDPELAAGVTVAAIFVATDLSTRPMGGILNESWVASTLALTCLLGAAMAMASVHLTAAGRTLRTVLTMGIILGIGYTVRPPDVLNGLAPWTAGALFLIGTGRLAGSSPEMDRSPRRLATGLALIATNVAGGAAVLVLPVVLGLTSLVRDKDLQGKFMQVLAALAALAAAVLCTWLPYQLPAWDQPMIQLPTGDIVVDVSKTVIVLPLMGLGAALYFGWGRMTSDD